ncbi:MAG: DMT family transporter [Pseudomonadota bacterium]|nr:DMT family transporter [Pseudomonadota bacterium]
MDRRGELWTVVLIAVAAGAWGVYWIPQRALADGGLSGGWSTIGQFLVPLILLSPIALVRRLRGHETGVGMPLIGLLFGGGIVFYANSFLLTDVVRALLMFYLLPVWGTLLELLVLRRSVAPARALTLVLGLGGVWLVFGADGGWPLPSNSGDWLGLLGGMIIALALTRMIHIQPEGVFAPLFAYCFYGTMVAMAMAFVLGNQFGPPPDADGVTRMLPWLTLMAVAFIIPTNCALMWGASRVSPGLFGIVILTEVVLGVVSAALWADEPFGWREAVGGAMILAAGTCEALVVARRTEAEAA